jgi:hypothetical protein
MSFSGDSNCPGAIVIVQVLFTAGGNMTFADTERIKRERVELGESTVS